MKFEKFRNIALRWFSFVPWFFFSWWKSASQKEFLFLNFFFVLQNNEESREITFSQNRTPPSPKHHIRLEDKDWESILPQSAGGNTPSGDLVKPLLMLHPIEVARQLTLLEFDLYRSVKPSELVGNAWTKSDKELKSPNLLKMIHHTNNVTRWVMRCIIDCDNFEERVAVMTRVVEMMIMLYEFNNFSGLFEMSSALESASVHRLEHTKAEVKKRLPPGQKIVYEEAMELGKNHYKKYLEKLRSINPPCVPFFGMYLTNIMHIEVGNPDVLPPHNLINFSKRRKFAEITGEIQQYQNQAYCFQIEPAIKHFLETLSPFEGMNDSNIDNYLYNKSLEVEPKNSKRPLVRERRWPNLLLKSPGIKPRRTLPNPINNMLFSKDKDNTSDSANADSSSQPLTPPTPSTPSTPPPASNTPNSIPPTSLSSTSSMSHSTTSLSYSTSVSRALPPPLSVSSGGAVLSQTLPASFRQERPLEQEEPIFVNVEIGAGKEDFP